MPSLKELIKKQDLLSGGHRACAGCGATIIVRQVLLAAQYPVVVGASTGCLEVVTTIFPYTAWKVPFIHSAFENVAATIAGVETGYRALKEKGKIKEEIRFIAFGGDGGTYDIGLQALSGAIERGHRMLYICYNNQAYMNTGIQRSSATPYCAHTTTSPAGKVIPGKPQFRKDLTEIVIAHDIPYAAQASLAYWNDLTKKVQKALEVDGPSFINVLSVCPLGWGVPSDMTVEIARLAVETCFWPLYEYENGKYIINRKPREKKPIEEFLKKQNRFRHIFRHPDRDKIIARIQKEIDRRWERLLKRAG
ncbi:pyruvate ferredoxin oxidoreductase [candidate division WOR-3 bacterium]|uniref:Pyruvate ferredoxin oxidoreductase n=1 Tax=candidate division WOR-3 bacterium TaxID=2052148 RepID=A0A660SIL1_UNCW3|nr:MAG: pyruvate ferredoxin oxidoreductase [candidate division WOR-3 bacterium]